MIEPQTAMLGDLSGRLEHIEKSVYKKIDELSIENKQRLVLCDTQCGEAAQGGNPRVPLLYTSFCLLVCLQGIHYLARDMNRRSGRETADHRAVTGSPTRVAGSKKHHQQARGAVPIKTGCRPEYARRGCPASQAGSDREGNSRASWEARRRTEKLGAAPPQQGKFSFSGCELLSIHVFDVTLARRWSPWTPRSTPQTTSSRRLRRPRPTPGAA